MNSTGNFHLKNMSYLKIATFCAKCPTRRCLYLETSPKQQCRIKVAVGDSVSLSTSYWGEEYCTKLKSHHEIQKVLFQQLILAKQYKLDLLFKPLKLEKKY